MRRLLLPILLLAIAMAATVQMNRANEHADPGRATEVSTEPDLATPLLSARRAPEWLRSPESDALLTSHQLRAARRRAGTTCVLVERRGSSLRGAPRGFVASAELHRLITASVMSAVGGGSGFRTGDFRGDHHRRRGGQRPSSRVISGSSAGATKLATTGYISFRQRKRLPTSTTWPTKPLPGCKNAASSRSEAGSSATKASTPNERDTTTLIETSEGRVNVWDQQTAGPMRSARSRLAPQRRLCRLARGRHRSDAQRTSLRPIAQRRPSTTSLNSPGLPAGSARDGVAPPIAERRLWP